jgi:dTDP-4-dehydrorhamnose 3,5-epimerase
VGTRLSAQNKQQLWLPAGFAHGFLTLSEEAEVLYKTSDFWSQSCERAIRWDDPQLQVAWPLEDLAGAAPHLSMKDDLAPMLVDLAPADLFP